MMDHSLEAQFLEWFRQEAAQRLTEGYTDIALRLTNVVEVPGDPDFNAQALSFALQAELPTVEEAHQWAQDRLIPEATRYVERFGADKALYFPTILRTVNI